MTYLAKMISELYRETLENELGRAGYLLSVLIVSSLQILRQTKLENLAGSLPLPILFESRKKKLKRFLKRENFSIERIWFPCLKKLLEEKKLENKGWVYIALDRTSWRDINLLMVSVIYDGRALPIYWQLLAKKGSSGYSEQQEVLEKAFGALSNARLVVLGDREFCSVKLARWLSDKGVYFCLRQKANTNVKTVDGVIREVGKLGLRPGMKLFLNGVEMTKLKGFGSFNLAGKWKKNYREFAAKEPWYILTNLTDLEKAVAAYRKRFCIEEMFRDFKSGGYSLEGCRIAPETLSKLIICIAIAYTSATFQGKQIQKKALQKYVTRPEKTVRGQRRHSGFYVGQHLYHWLDLHRILQETIEEILRISRHRLKDHLKGQRAIELALSIF